MSQANDRAAELASIQKQSQEDGQPKPQKAPQPKARKRVDDALPANAVTELEARLETLKAWHVETSQRLTKLQSELEGREQTLAQSQTKADALQAKAEQELDEAKEAREKLERDRGAFEKYCQGEEAALTKQKLACEEWVAAQNAAAEEAAKTLRVKAEQDIEIQTAEATARIAQQHAELEDERVAMREEAQRLSQVRDELDTEWASVRKVGEAQQALIQTWEDERQRVQSAQLRLVGGEIQRPTHEASDTDDTGHARAA